MFLVDDDDYDEHDDDDDDDQDGKYMVLPSGELHIRDVAPEDGYKSYRCRTKHRLTGDTRLSATAGRLVVTGESRPSHALRTTPPRSAATPPLRPDGTARPRGRGRRHLRTKMSAGRMQMMSFAYDRPTPCYANDVTPLGSGALAGHGHLHTPRRMQMRLHGNGVHQQSWNASAAPRLVVPVLSMTCLSSHCTA